MCYVPLRVWLPLLAGSLSLLVGCNRGPDLAPVSGRVTYNGKAVGHMLINFTPLGETGGNGAVGCTDADGRYSLLDARGDKGAYVGEYQVSFYPTASPQVQADPALDVVSVPKRGTLPAIYMDPRQSPLRAKVPKGGDTIDFDLK